MTTSQTITAMTINTTTTITAISHPLSPVVGVAAAITDWRRQRVVAT